MRIFCSKDTQKRWQHILIQEEWTENYFEHLGKQRKKKSIGLIERDRPLIFSQSGLKATRKTENQVSLKDSPLDNWSYFQQFPILNEEYSNFVNELVPKIFNSFKFEKLQTDNSKYQTSLDLEEAIVILGYFKSEDGDHMWQTEFLADLFRKVYSHEPYLIENCILIIGSGIEENNNLSEINWDKISPLPSPVSSLNFRTIYAASQESYPVIYLKKVKINENIIWTPFLYLPPIEYGFGAG